METEAKTETKTAALAGAALAALVEKMSAEDKAYFTGFLHGWMKGDKESGKKKTA